MTQIFSETGEVFPVTVVIAEDTKGQTLSTDSQGLTLGALMHQTIKKVSDDIESMKFNTAVSTLMIFVNELEKETKLSKTVFDILLLLLAPFAPHMTEELWQTLGHKDSIHTQKWPAYNPEELSASEVVVVVQVNGKVRGKFNARPDMSETEAKDTALNLAEVKKWILGKEIQTFIYKPGKIVSIVV